LSHILIYPFWEASVKSHRQGQTKELYIEQNDITGKHQWLILNGIQFDFQRNSVSGQWSKVHCLEDHVSDRGVSFLGFELVSLYHFDYKIITTLAKGGIKLGHYK